MEGMITEGLASWQVFILQAGVLWVPLVVAAIKQNGTNKALKKRITELETENIELKLENEQLRNDFIQELRNQATGRKGI